ncbi:uncharacterized protein LOC127804358 [Diospyros lotus]|uniref:uncharacterized protein LOC127804358 n=1 Tax=Diospyros lotus TaxID=55363 RepID=UPI00224F67C5|nr:uncharacterized protein LOC127804358 [Diospyros lotus]
MGGCEPEFGLPCEKHPTHHPQPGVCPVCLADKLSELSVLRSSSRNKKTAMASTFCSSSLSSSPVYSSGSSPSSPGYRRHHRVASDVMMGSFSLFESGGGGGGNNNAGLSKSRSVACDAKTRAREGVGRKKKGGFWWRLIRSTGKKTKRVFGHSSAMNKELNIYYV